MVRMMSEVGIPVSQSPFPFLFPDSHGGSLHDGPLLLPCYVCLQHCHRRRPFLPPGGFPILFLQLDNFQEAAMKMGTWPQSGGPKGGLGETLKTWTNQAGLPLVSAT